jgi:pyridoxal phosphate enzyme (YggS family)
MKERYQKILAEIAEAAIAADRAPESVRLVAVSKTMNAEIVGQAIAAGVTLLGENYIQEARDKFNQLSAHSATWHFIGHLQSNKAKYAVRMFDLIHSVDSLKIAKALDKSAQKIAKTQGILIQVNNSGENSKSGVAESECIELIREISMLDNVAIKGLMTMPPFFDDPDRARPYFKALRELRDEVVAQNITGVCMDELSMGMSGDYKAAISEGATLVRIGTAIFGERT